MKLCIVWVAGEKTNPSNNPQQGQGEGEEEGLEGAWWDRIPRETAEEPHGMEDVVGRGVPIGRSGGAKSIFLLC